MGRLATQAGVLWLSLASLLLPLRRQVLDALSLGLTTLPTLVGVLSPCTPVAAPSLAGVKLLSHHIPPLHLPKD